MCSPDTGKYVRRYRFTFQSQESDNEIRGKGNSLNYKFRMHDPRVGRFFAVDPLAGKYPWNSSYAFSENRLIDGVELEGLEWAPYDADGNRLDINTKGWQDNVADYQWEGYDEVWSPGQSVHQLGDLTLVPKAGTVKEGAIVENKIAFEGMISDGKLFTPDVNVKAGARFYDVAGHSPFVEWASKVGEQLDYTGSMQTNSNGTYSSGLLNLSSVYSNKKTILNHSWSAISGPWGNGSLENGAYIVNHLIPNRTGAYSNHGVGFSFDVIPQFSTERTDLRIHPDGGDYFGTLGCIGLTGNASELKSAVDRINNALMKSIDLDLNVSINGNPNNDGR